jgi:glycosyltransferase involved in cell wall biosynthesis
MTESAASNASPMVTIGISTFNRVDGTFPQALSSALAQTYPKVEVVVCDNASTDGTEGFMAEQRDPRLKYLRHPVNIGAHANFNACLDQAQGQYFLLLHDDDLLEEGFVASAMAALGERRPGVVLGGVRLIDGQGGSLGSVAAPDDGGSGADLFRAWFERRCSFYFCSTLFHTCLLREAGGFATPEGLLQDVVAIAVLSHRAGYVSVPVIAGSFRRHAANRGGASPARRWLRDAEYLLELLERLFPEDARRLMDLGRPYLAAKCYRYVDQVPSISGRWRLYRDIDRAFGNTLSPLTFLAHRSWRGVRARLGDLRRRARLAP